MDNEREGLLPQVMGYVPKDAKWFIAELVEELRVQDDPDNVLHRNLILVRAGSAADAYDRAMELGKAGEIQYLNTDGKQVNVRFRGIAHLDVIHDSLEHGAELMFHSKIGVCEQDIVALVRRKDELSAFRPIEQVIGPNYAAADIMNDVAEALSTERQEDK